ncbi:MAG: HAD-IA family hydrolase [Nanoarchaeota archaeon]
MEKRQFINVLDEQGRFLELKASPANESSQQDSHTTSYLRLRREYQNGGFALGLGNETDHQKPENLIIAYDLDGTLYDFGKICFSVDQVIRRELGYPDITSEFYVSEFQSRDWNKFYRDLGIRDDDLEKVIEMFIERFKATESPKLIPGAREALRRTEEAIGHNNIFIITNETTEGVRKRFERDNLIHYIDRVDNPMQGKANELYKLAMCNGNEGKRVVYIGDLVSDGEDCLKARKAGAKNLRFYGITHGYAMNPREKMLEFVARNANFAETLNSLDEIDRIWKGR